MKRPTFTEKRKILDIDRGLFLIRYAAADDDVRPPAVRVALDPCGNRENRLVLHPDLEEATLAEPGSTLVVRAVSRAKLDITVRSQGASGSLAATIQIESLNAGVAREGASEAPAAGDGPRIVGHVAGLGDVVAAANEWIGGPAAPSRIEGFAIDWPGKPADIDIRYAVKLARAAGPVGALREAGTFAGTRGRAMPITGLALELGGGRANRLAVEALFLGAPPIRASGPRIDLNGPTGREPLVGLRLVYDPQPARRPAAPPAPKPRAPSRVKVFRGQAKAPQPAA